MKDFHQYPEALYLVTIIHPDLKPPAYVAIDAWSFTDVEDFVMNALAHNKDLDVMEITKHYGAYAKQIGGQDGGGIDFSIGHDAKQIDTFDISTLDIYDAEAENIGHANWAEIFASVVRRAEDPGYSRRVSK